MLPESERIQALEVAKRLVTSLEHPDISEHTRVEALRDAASIVSSLDKPEDAMLKFAYTPATWMAVRTFVQLNVFAMLSEKDETSIQEVCKRTRADEILLRRLFRVLTATGFVAEKGIGLYGPTKWTQHLASRTTDGMVRFIYDLGMATLSNTPDYLEQTGYANPSDGRNGPFQSALKCPDVGIFDWFSRPENSSDWEAANSFFEGDRGSRPSWVTWFPVQEKLIDGSDPDTPLLVDVAGGRGHDLLEFYKKFPKAGSLVLQDQQPVLDGAVSLDSAIRKEKINFFKESPVPGARIYFLKFILHDWSDEVCLTILKNVSASMTKGYSYLVINDFILPDQGCPLIAAQWDMMMMAYMSAMERSETQWRDLMARAGLQIEGLYQPPGDGQGIIVATLV